MARFSRYIGEIKWRVACRLRAAAFLVCGGFRLLRVWFAAGRVRVVPAEAVEFAVPGAGVDGYVSTPSSVGQFFVLRRHGSPGVAGDIFRGHSAPSRSELRNTMANLFQFIQDVRTETEKVTWPTRRETLITSGIVIVLVIFISLFFLVVDEALRLIVSFILSFGH